VAVTSTTTFLPNIGEITEEAFERAGLEMTSGYDLRTARRSLDLLLLEWQNRGINLWAVEEITYDSLGTGLGTETLVEGTGAYTLRSETISVLQMLIRENDGVETTQSDIELSRISRNSYYAIPSKLTQAKPTQVYIDRQRDSVIANLWPVPSESDKYKLIYTRIRRLYDTGPGGTYDSDVPDRFWPALVAGLAYKIALKRPEASGRISVLKQDYDEQFNLAADEDREKAPVRFVPGGYSY
jgi:hypothetical protein